MTLRLSVLCLVLAAVGFENVNALSDESKAKILGAVLPHVAECSKEFGVTPEQIPATAEDGTIDPCLIKCILSKIKVINDEGLVDAQKAQELSTQYLANEKEQKTVEEMITTCASVNDKASGGDALSCQLAKSLFECMMPFKEKLKA